MLQNANELSDKIPEKANYLGSVLAKKTDITDITDTV